MRLFSLRHAFVAIVVLAGCEHDSFDVEIRPSGDGFDRKITCWHVGGKDDKEIQPLAPEKLARIAALYPKRETPADAKKQAFSGRFADSTPADVGGAGRVVRFDSPMGDAWCYAERFRGSDDLEAQLADRRRAADQLCDLIIGWLTAELGREPGFPELKKFLETNLRQDLKNVAVYAWTDAAAASLRPRDREDAGEAIARVGLYLCERGYFSTKELHRLARCDTAGDFGPLLAHLQRLLARRLGTPDDQPIPAALEFMGDENKVEASLDKYVRTTKLFKDRYAQWQVEKEKNPKSNEITPVDLVGELFDDAILQFSFDTEDALNVKLFCGRKPFSTNGGWDEKLAAATWSAGIKPDRTAPTFCFACWSEPNEEFQKAHFGRVVLVDGDLADYAVWHRSLKPEEAEEWDRFVGGLKPDSDWRSAVKTFRFAADPKPAPNQPPEKVPSLADIPRRVLVKEEKGGP